MVKSGAYKNNNKNKKPKRTIPIWWNDDCARAVKSRSQAWKVFLSDQSAQALQVYLGVDFETKIFLKNKKLYLINPFVHLLILVWV